MKINYPNPSINHTSQKKTINRSHGMLFESALNSSNEFYRNKNLAFIYKKPTPIQIVKVDYPIRSKARITEAYYKTPSTTDYNGIYKGKYIDYEAKETEHLTFSFKFISEHQIIHLLKINEHGGIAFIIIYFRRVNRVFIIDILKFYDLYIHQQENNKKSISIPLLEEKGKEVSLGYTPVIDYLQAVDDLYFTK